MGEDSADSGSESVPVPIDQLDPSQLPQGASPCQAPVLVRVDYVIDGDTVVVNGAGVGSDEHVRLIGVNTPEIGYNGNPDACFAQDARQATNDRVGGQRVWLTFDGECRDNYDRLLAYAYTGADEADWLNWWLLHEGYGTSLFIAPNDTFREPLLAAEGHARVNDLGLWGACP